MTRTSYKDALRAKGVKPIPPMCILRSSLNQSHDHITRDGRVS